MPRAMLLLYVLLLPIVIAQVTEFKCEERLDIITPSAWPALPITYFGRNITEEAELVNIETKTKGAHAVVHTTRNETYLYGSSRYFHLYGSGITRELVEIRGQRVVDIQFGGHEDYLVILTAGGSIWTMGRNLYGQLAHHDTQDRNILSKVEGLPAVRQIAVGQELCVVLARNGQLFSWGRNDQLLLLGYNTSNDINPTPQPITLGQEMTLTESLCCGRYQCAVLTDNMKVLTWGYSPYIGRPQGDHIIGEVVGIPRNQNITKISCGEYHTLVLTANGTLYGWGDNEFGELLQAPNEAPRATALELDGRVVRDVEAGIVLTVVRTFSPFAEYFGRYDDTNYNTIQTAPGMVHGRDVMAKSFYGQDTLGSVRVNCTSNMG